MHHWGNNFFFCPVSTLLLKLLKLPNIQQSLNPILLSYEVFKEKKYLCKKLHYILICYQYLPFTF